MQQKGRVGKSGSFGLGFNYHIWVKVIILVPVHQTLTSFSWNLIKPRSYYAITGGFIISSLYRIDGFLCCSDMQIAVVERICWDYIFGWVWSSHTHVHQK